MKRLTFALILLALVVAPVAARAAPTGIFPSVWTYSLPPAHTLNGFAAFDGLWSNLGTTFRQFVELPFGFYLWAEGRYEGLLAESWGFTEDNSAYRVMLKEATWSDGTPVTSNDVLVTFAIGRILDWTVFEDISDVVVVDDRTVNFVFKSEPSLRVEYQLMKEIIMNGAVYQTFADKAYALFAAKKTPDDQEWQDLINEIAAFRPTVLLASGPYTYTLENVGDSYLSLKWQPNSIYSDSVNFGEIRLWNADTEGSVPLVLNGDVAWTTHIFPPAVQQAFRDAGLRLITSPRGGGPAVLMNHDVYPFAIKEVRQAMAYAIDRAQNAFLTNGFGATPAVYMSGVEDVQVHRLLDEASIAQLNHYPYDLEAAEAKMQDAGFTRDAEGKWVDAEGNRISVDYIVPAEWTDFNAAGSDAAEQLDKFGFDITLIAVPVAQGIDDVLAGNFELTVGGWAGTSPFATSQLMHPVHTVNTVGLTAIDGQGMNFPMQFEYEGEMIDLNRMILDVSNGLDVDAQKIRAGRVALILNDLLPYIPLNSLVSVQPWNEALLVGAPADDDPLIVNQDTFSDHFVIKLLLDGTLRPAQ